MSILSDIKEFIKSNSKLKLCLMLLVILGTGTIAKVVLLGNLFELSIILLSSYIIARKKYRLPTRFIKLIFISIIFVFISSIITSVNVVNYLGVLMRFIAAGLVLIAYNRNLSDIRDNLRCALWITTILATTNYILYLIIPNAFVPINSELTNAQTICYIFNYVGPRNQGPFTEPGNLQIFVNLLILIEVVNYKRPIMKLWLPILIVISTASTSGMIILAIIIGYSILTNRKFINSIVAIALTMIAFTPILISNVEDKLNGESSISSAYRYYDLIMGANIVRQHPILGIGIDNDKYKNMTTYISSDKYSEFDLKLERGNSNGIMETLIFCGIPFLLISLYQIYKQPICDNKKLFIIFYLISLCSEPLFFTVFNFAILMSYSLLDKRIHKYENSN